MTYVDYDRKMVYLATLRTASRATAQTLRDNGFEKEGPYHSGLEPVKMEKNEIESVSTTIRDPLEIMLSFVRRNIRKRRDICDIIEDEVEDNQWIEKGI